MPRTSATRRASYTSSIEQQRPRTCSGMPSRPARRRWFQSCMVNPTTLCPSARSMAATVEESTPPDMATAIILLAIQHSKKHTGKKVPSAHLLCSHRFRGKGHPLFTWVRVRASDHSGGPDWMGTRVRRFLEYGETVPYERGLDA